MSELFGYNGKVAYINLTSKEIEISDLNFEDVKRAFLLYLAPSIALTVWLKRPRSGLSSMVSGLPRAVISADTSRSNAIEQRIIGSATHLVISRLNLSKPVTATAVKDTIERLTAEKAFSTDVADNIRIDSITDFFNSETGHLAFDDGNIIVGKTAVRIGWFFICLGIFMLSTFLWL